MIGEHTIGGDSPSDVKDPTVMKQYKFLVCVTEQTMLIIDTESELQEMIVSFAEMIAFFSDTSQYSTVCHLEVNLTAASCDLYFNPFCSFLNFCIPMTNFAYPYPDLPQPCRTLPNYVRLFDRCCPPP